MRIIILGNGVAGTMAAKTLRELDSAAEIEIFAEEKYHYYPRPNLIEFLAGNLPYERLFAFPEQWNERQKIAIHTGEPLVRIDFPASVVETRSGRRVTFDKLLIASGSSAFLPPLKGIEKKGVFTLRTLDDALAILDYLKGHPQVVILGGGLLGLETARALKMRGASVTVVEVSERLLPRQLDVRGAELLKAQFEKIGVEIRLGATATQIIGNGEVTGLKLQDGKSAAASMIITAAGVRPNVSLAASAGLAVDGGIVVSDSLQTSHPAVYAAGDAVVHRKRIYGILPASFDQARAAAFNILGQEKRYEGTVPSHTLKVAGVLVTSCGVVNPDSDAYEILIKEKNVEGIYKKIVLRDNRVVGAVWMGTRKGATDIVRLASAETNIGPWKGSILEDDFDFSIP